MHSAKLKMNLNWKSYNLGSTVLNANRENYLRSHDLMQLLCCAYWLLLVIALDPQPNNFNPGTNAIRQQKMIWWKNQNCNQNLNLNSNEWKNTVEIRKKCRAANLRLFCTPKRWKIMTIKSPGPRGLGLGARGLRDDDRFEV